MTELSEMKARHEAATGGPWTTKRHGKKHGAFSDQCIVAAVARGQGIYSPTSKGTFPANDQEFIAHARQDIPVLIAMVEARDEAINATLATFGLKYGLVARLHFEDKINSILKGKQDA